MNRVIRVHTGSRLHFGLFSLPSQNAGPWLNLDGQPTMPRRKFGGIGLMIDQPGVDLTVEEAPEWSAEGPLADRALQFAKSYCANLSASRARASIPWSHGGEITKTFRIRIEQAAPEHVGLGTGTQLGLAVAGAVGRLIGPYGTGFSAIGNAIDIGRGLRSAIGIHGFDWGGFVVEAGKKADDVVSPKIFFSDFPPQWGILLILPRGLQGAHGRREVEAFADLARCEADDRTTEALCRIVLLNMLPALEQFDLDDFGEAVFEFNRRSGAMFKSAQGGIYSHPRIEQIVLKLRELGIRGVGQSSWGPAIFAIVPEPGIQSIRNQLIAMGVFGEDESLVTGALNSPAHFPD